MLGTLYSRANLISLQLQNSVPKVSSIQYQPFEDSKRFFISTKRNIVEPSFSSFNFQRRNFNKPIFSKGNIPNSPSQNLLNSENFLKRRQFSTFAEKIRNIAIIAHVDHGKTTLVDQLLKQSGSVQHLIGERVMDSNDLERERGITILAKTTSIGWKGYKLNIVDTPGHGDFGGEVERILTMVDGVVLLVDVNEGVMSQTKFVLTKALHAKLLPIVVLNKVDRLRDSHSLSVVENEIFELFGSLEASNEQMEYPTLYASGRNGWAIKHPKEKPEDLTPLFETIVNYIKPPKVLDDPRFSLLATTLDSDPFFGRIIIGRIMSGSVTVGTKLNALDLNGKLIESAKVFKIVARDGLERIIIDKGEAGDIIGISGFDKATVTNTLCDPEISTPIPTIPLDPPVVSAIFSVNTSPLGGKEGKQVTFPAIKKRLEKEVEGNISLTLKFSGGESVEVFGRGELQLAILIENMRREGFEFSVSPPQVVLQRKGEKLLEPLEEITVDVDQEYVSQIIEKIGNRKGDILEIKEVTGKTRITARCFARTLLGFRSELLSSTRGTAIYNHLFHSYVDYQPNLLPPSKGALISMASGKSTFYALESLEARGTLFIAPGEEVYPGMIIGENAKEGDLEVNPTKTKHLTNVRSASKEEFVQLIPPKKMTLEEFITYVKPGELLEVTPHNIRLRRLPTQKKK